MTTFNRDAILFRALPDSKVELPRSSNEAKFYLATDGSIKLLHYNGEVTTLGSKTETVVHNTETLVVYDDSLLKQQIEELAKLLARTNSSILEAINDDKNDTVAQLASLQVALLSLGEEKNRDLADATKQLQAFVVEQVVTTESQLRDELTQATQPVTSLQGFVATLAESIQALAQNIKTNNAITDGKIRLLERADSQIRSEIPVVVSGSKNVSVSKTDNVYRIAVKETEKIIERIVETGGGGMTRSQVQKMLDAVVAPPTTIQSSGGTIVVVPLEAGGYNLEVAGAAPVITPISITSFTGGSTNEIGTSVNVSLAWSYNYNPDTSQSLNQGIGSVPLSAFIYTITDPITANTTYTLSVTDSVRGSTAANTSVAFIPRIYWGVAPSSSLSSSDIVAGSSILSSSKGRTIAYNCSGGHHFWYAVPAAYGAVTATINNLTYTSWSDGSGGETVSPYQVTVTNIYLNDTLYNVYASYYVQFGSNIQVVYS